MWRLCCGNSYHFHVHFFDFNEVVYLFTCLLAIWVSSFQKYLFNSSAYFSIRLSVFIFFSLILRSFLYIILWALWLLYMLKYFFFSCGFLFNSLELYFNKQVFLILMLMWISLSYKFTFVIVVFLFCCFLKVYLLIYSSLLSFWFYGNIVDM